MTEYTLHKAFWHLTKFSSYTWAAEIHRLFTQFVNDFEAWARTNPPGTSVAEEEVLRRVWHQQGKGEEGIELLRTGLDRHRAYQLLGEGFNFVHLFWHDRWFEENVDTTTLEKIGFVPRYDRFDRPCTGMFQALGAASHMSNCLIFGPGLRAHKDAQRNLERLPFRREYCTPLWTPSQFPPLPTPDTTIEILSGEEAPVTGIWLPEPIAEDPIAVNMLTKTGGKQTYCMNFMVQGKVAPKMISEEEHLLVMEQDYRPIPKDRTVRWRLLWKDERYGENGIPEEEKDYLRVEEAATAPTERVDSGVIRCEGGKSCPRSGYWHVWHEAGTRRYFNEGDSMPGGSSSQGERIWYWDNDQST